MTGVLQYGLGRGRCTRTFDGQDRRVRAGEEMTFKLSCRNEKEPAIQRMREKREWQRVPGSGALSLDDIPHPLVTSSHLTRGAAAPLVILQANLNGVLPLRLLSLPTPASPVKPFSNVPCPQGPLLPHGRSLPGTWALNGNSPLKGQQWIPCFLFQSMYFSMVDLFTDADVHCSNQHSWNCLRLPPCHGLSRNDPWRTQVASPLLATANQNSSCKSYPSSCIQHTSCARSRAEQFTNLVNIWGYLFRIFLPVLSPPTSFTLMVRQWGTGASVEGERQSRRRGSGACKSLVLSKGLSRGLIWLFHKEKEGVSLMETERKEGGKEGKRTGEGKEMERERETERFHAEPNRCLQGFFGKGTKVYGSHRQHRPPKGNRHVVPASTKHSHLKFVAWRITACVSERWSGWWSDSVFPLTLTYLGTRWVAILCILKVTFPAHEVHSGMRVKSTLFWDNTETCSIVCTLSLWARIHTRLPSFNGYSILCFWYSCFHIPLKKNIYGPGKVTGHRRAEPRCIENCLTLKPLVLFTKSLCKTSYGQPLIFLPLYPLSTILPTLMMSSIISPSSALRLTLTSWSFDQHYLMTLHQQHFLYFQALLWTWVILFTKHCFLFESDSWFWRETTRLKSQWSHCVTSGKLLNLSLSPSPHH